MQEEFLEALAGDAKGDYRLAMDMAGYSKSTKISDMVGFLRDELIELGRAKLALISMKAVNQLEDTLDTVAIEPGTKERLAAANSILDRVGISKTENVKVEVEGPTPVFILPPKDSKVEE